MKSIIKNYCLNLWQIENHIRAHIYISRIISNFSLIGRYLALIMDRALLIIYGIDLDSTSIQIKKLSISHPVGVLLGGNGIYSKGRVAIMAGVKFVAKSPLHSKYKELHKKRKVFELGDNVVLGTNTTILGPVKICDNVIVGAMSLVNKDITEPGVYVGAPIKKISSIVTHEWVAHL
jgi:serine acetyltransferase